MKKKDKIAIVRFKASKGNIVRFGCLLPSLDPPGWYFVFLPFADDLRNPENFFQLNTQVKPS